MGTIRKGILVLDPRTKILLLLGINIFVFTNSHVYAEMLVVAALVILLLLCGVYKTALKSTITYIVLLAIKCWILPFCPEIIMTSLNIVVITFRKLLPCVTLGALLVQTTPIRLLMHAMQKWHLPQAVIIPLAITVRYFPTLHEEQQAISDAMKLRNVHGVFQKLEYIYVPLMLSASTTADELSQAITARGIDNPRPKTCAVSMRFHIQDYVLCFVAIVLVIIAFVLLLRRGDFMITFENLSFSYGNTGEEQLNSLDLQIKRGNLSFSVEEVPAVRQLQPSASTD